MVQREMNCNSISYTSLDRRSVREVSSASKNCVFEVKPYIRENTVELREKITGKYLWTAIAKAHNDLALNMWKIL